MAEPGLLSQAGALALKALSIDTVALPIPGYPMSWIELVGTALYLWSVRLVVKGRLLTWPVGILSVLLFAWLFYQVRLYADALEQAYYLGASLFGWWRWNRQEMSPEVLEGYVYSSAGARLSVLAGTAFLSLSAGFLLSRVHEFALGIFPEPASFPWIDAATTIASFTAMALMALKRIECWLYWITVDVAAVGLYAVKGIFVLSILYAILLGMAVQGWLEWRSLCVRRTVFRPGYVPKS